MADNRKFWQVSDQKCEGRFTIAGQKIFGKLHCCQSDSCDGDKREQPWCLHGKRVPFFKLMADKDSDAVTCLGKTDGLITLKVLIEYCSAYWKTDSSEWFVSSMIGNEGEAIEEKAENVPEALLMLANGKRNNLVKLLSEGTALLHYMPQEAWSKFSGDDWTELLSHQPVYLNYYLCCANTPAQRLNNEQFRKVLQEQPEMVHSNPELHNCLTRLTNSDFLTVFKAKPRLANIFDRYKNFSAAEWKELFLVQFDFFKDNDDAWKTLAQNPQICTELLREKPEIRSYFIKRRISARFTDEQWNEIKHNNPDAMTVWKDMYPNLGNYTLFPNAPEFCRKVWAFPFWAMVFLLIFCGGIVSMQAINAPGLHLYNLLHWIVGLVFSIFCACVACACGINVRGKHWEIIGSALLTAGCGITFAYAFVLFYPFSSGLAVIFGVLLVVGIMSVLCAAFRDNAVLFRILYMALAMLIAANICFILNRNTDDSLGIARALNRSFWRFPKLRDRHLKKYLEFGQKEKWERACAVLNAVSLRESAENWKPQEWDKASLEWWNPDESMRASAVKALGIESMNVQNGEGLSLRTRTWIELYWEVFPANATLDDPVAKEILKFSDLDFENSFDKIEAWLKKCNHDFASILLKKFTAEKKAKISERARKRADALIEKLNDTDSEESFEISEIKDLYSLVGSDDRIDSSRLNYVACITWLSNNKNNQEAVECFCELEEQKQEKVFKKFSQNLLPNLWTFKQEWFKKNWRRIFAWCSSEQKKEYSQKLLDEFDASGKNELLRYLKKHDLIDSEEVLKLYAEHVAQTPDWAEFLEANKAYLSREYIIKLAEYYLQSRQFANGFKHIFEQQAFDNQRFIESLKSDEAVKTITGEQIAVLRQRAAEKNMQKVIVRWWELNQVSFDIEKARFAFAYAPEKYWKLLCRVAARDGISLTDDEKNKIAGYFLNNTDRDIPADVKSAMEKLFADSENINYLRAMARLENGETALKFLDKLKGAGVSFDENEKIRYAELKYTFNGEILSGFKKYAEQEKTGKASFAYFEHLAGRAFFQEMTDDEVVALINPLGKVTLFDGQDSWLQKAADKKYFKAVALQICLKWNEMRNNRDRVELNRQKLNEAKSLLTNDKEKEFIDQILNRLSGL